MKIEIVKRSLKFHNFVGVFNNPFYNIFLFILLNNFTFCLYLINKYWMLRYTSINHKMRQNRF